MRNVQKWVLAWVSFAGLVFFIGNGAWASEPCRNASQIEVAARLTGEALDRFQVAVQENYRWAPTLVQDTQRARVEVSWLERVSGAQWVSCDFAVRSAASVETRMRGLMNQFRVFSFFRREQPIQAEWDAAMDVYTKLKAEVSLIESE